jgi:hypothetical protein
MQVKLTRTNSRRVKKTLVTLESTRTGRHSFLVDAEVDEDGTARISLAQRYDMMQRAGITNEETFSF